MIDENAQPHRGDEIDGYQASISPGLSPRLGRYLLHSSHMRSAYAFLFLVTPIGLGVLWLGWKILSSTSNLKAFLLGVGLCGIGGLMTLLGPILGIGIAFMARSAARKFRNSLLIPGLVISKDPLAIVGLADLGKSFDRKGKEFGIARNDLWTVPNYSSEVGTRIPCVADFSEIGPDRFYYYSPTPVSHATGDPFDLEQCMQRLGEAPFQRLERLVARDLAPEHWNRMVVVDANDEVSEVRNYMEAGEMRKAAENPQAAEVQA
jgi:hypothetical protein